MRLRRRPSSGVGVLCRNFELEPLGHDPATSKGVGSKMAEEVGASGHQIRGRATPQVLLVTAPSSISGLKASGLGRLRTCACARVRVGPPFSLQVLVMLSWLQKCQLRWFSRDARGG